MHQTSNVIRIFGRLSRNLCNNKTLNVKLISNYSTKHKAPIVLGIETSCDDTGIAIVDSTGKILGNAINSQLLYHLEEGGINPIDAYNLHVENIQKVYEECLQSANIQLSDVDAIAATVHPGLMMSLKVGKEFAINLAKTVNKPFIPIHHMQAHALTARMIDKVDFPFLVLLMSGGHCLLALAKSVDQFKILGQTKDNSIGESMDKVARRLKLMNILEYSNICGGKAIELAAAKATDPYQFPFPHPMSQHRDCNFSFSGIKTKAINYIIAQENEYNIRGPDIIPDVNNLCAAYLMTVTSHVSVRLQRAIEYCDKNELIPKDKQTVVVSGGVASNNFIVTLLTKVCTEVGYRLVRPPPNLCTDNGIMIAWNGIEKYLTNIDVLSDVNQMDRVDISHKVPIGEDWSELVEKESIKRKWIKYKFNDIVGR